MDAPMDVTRTSGLLSRMESALDRPSSQEASATEAFQSLLQHTSDLQKNAGAAADQYLLTGEGELHDVQTQLAQAELTFRFLVEVRNKLSEAYQEVSRLSV